MEVFEWLLTNAQRVGCLPISLVVSVVILWLMTASRQTMVRQYRYPDVQMTMGRLNPRHVVVMRWPVQWPKAPCLGLVGSCAGKYSDLLVRAERASCPRRT